jgi:mono/diheme cytochrome c family protein
MGTSLSMWFGIAFLLIGIAATVLQAWLWSFPMAPDPGGPDPAGKSTAPPLGVLTHRCLGLAFVLIYIVMMWQMVPRLWEYQFELPARTVMHAVMGIVIGCLLITKISIIRWFQHFGKALPALGLGVMMCTVILATLSLPFAMRAHGMNVKVFEPENMERVARALRSSGIQGMDPTTVADLVSEEGLDAGRDVLMYKCAVCHDMRTVLMKPRSAASWYKLSDRMAEKPNLGPPLTEEDIPRVTAYLVAISPDLQRTLKQKRALKREKAERVAVVQRTMEKEKGALTKTPYDLNEARSLYEDHCSQCHELDDILEHGEDSLEGWAKIVKQMIIEEEAEITDVHATLIIRYLAATFPLADAAGGAKQEPGVPAVPPELEVPDPGAEPPGHGEPG